MNRLLISTGLVLCLAGFTYAQDNSAQTTTSTQTTTTQSTGQSSANDANSDAATTNNSGNWGAGKPEGTKVTGHDVDTLVQPKRAPVEVNASVIKAAQQKLNDAGYNAGATDGMMGPQTRAALKKFQADKNLPQSGQLDQKTMAALNVGGVQELKAAPTDVGRAGKAIGHDVAGGHPVAAGKAAVEGGKNAGTKVGQGVESTAVKVKDKVGSGLSAVGDKISGAGENKKAGQTTEQSPTTNSGNDTTSTTNNPPRQ